MDYEPANRGGRNYGWRNREGAHDHVTSPAPAYLPLILHGRQVMATYADMEELIRLGAYRAGSSPEVDEAIRLHEPLESFLRQAKDEVTGLGDGYRQLEQILANLETER